MKIWSGDNKKQGSLLLALAILLGFLVYSKGYPSLQGIFWGFSQGRIGYLYDQISCRIKSPDACTIDFDELNVNFGVYDPSGSMDDNYLIALDHYFLNWNDSSFIQNLKGSFLDSDSKNRWSMITVEPWGKHDNDRQLLSDIYRGKYDDQIREICSQVKRSPHPVFIRWGQEMEYVTGRYPWASENSQDFKEAYNHFVQICKSETYNGYYVWSPAGNKNLDSYWPGGLNVDYVGISLFVFQEFEKRNSGYIRHFRQMFQTKYELVKKYKKPVMIAEFGITGNEQFSKIWWYNACKNLKHFDQLKTIVYFNSKDNPGAWIDYEIPDWTISENIFPVKR
jgi:cellulose synthase (UDP-forming)